MRSQWLVSLSFLVGVCCLAVPAAASELTPIDPSQVSWFVDSFEADAQGFQDPWRRGEAARTAARQGNVLRARVPLPNGDWRAPTLLLEGVGGQIELWVDDERLPTPSGATTAMSATRAIPVPLSALGQSVELRVVKDTYPPGLKRVSIGEHARVNDRLARDGFLPTAAGLLMLVVALVALAAWVPTRTDRFLLRVFVFAFAAGSLALGLGVSTGVFLGEPAQLAFLYLGVASFPWAIVALVRDAFPEHRLAPGLWLERVCLGWGVVFIGATAFGDSGFTSVLAPFVFLPAIASSLLVAVKAARTGDVDGRLLMVGLGFFLAVVGYDSLPLFGVLDSTGFHVYLSLLVMTAAFVAIFARRMAQAARTLRAQTHALEEREREGRAVTQRLVSDASELLAAVAQLRESGASQNETIEQQATSLQETQVTAEEIRRTSTLAAEKAQALLAQAAIADETQRAGELAVEESLERLSSIGTEVASMATAMGDVDQLAREIGGIVDVVKGLADQSNMLALNAAIEAVRSGEHGKGFAVVAREVRRLADQSLQSTQRIREVLERLAAGVRQSTAAGERGERSVATALERLRGSGEQLRAMSGILGETNASVRQISAAVTQQNAGISQIFTAVQQLSDQMKVTVDRMQEAEAATVVVEGVASRMSENRRVA